MQCGETSQVDWVQWCNMTKCRCGHVLRNRDNVRACSRAEGSYVRLCLRVGLGLRRQLLFWLRLRGRRLLLRLRLWFWGRRLLLRRAFGLGAGRLCTSGAAGNCISSGKGIRQEMARAAWAGNECAQNEKQAAAAAAPCTTPTHTSQHSPAANLEHSWGCP